MFDIDIYESELLQEIVLTCIWITNLIGEVNGSFIYILLNDIISSLIGIIKFFSLNHVNDPIHKTLYQV